MTSCGLTGEPMMSEALRPARAPLVDVELAARLAGEEFGVHPASVKDLGSHQDRNFAIDPGDGSGLLVLKVANSGQSLAALRAQDGALSHLAGRLAGLAIPAAIPSVSGQSVSGPTLVVVNLEADCQHAVRLLSFVPGIPLTDFGYLNPAAARAVGNAAGSVTAALADFHHQGASESSQWDLSRYDTVVTGLLDAVAEPDLRARISDAVAGVAAALATLPELPRQVIHGDLTDFNLVAERAADGSPRPVGVIDFGDLGYSWRAAEPAITICSLLARDPDRPLRIAADVLAGFTSACPLTDPERAALWPLVVARSAVGLVSTLAQLEHEPDNPYLHENLAVDRAVFDIATAVPLSLAAAVLGLPPTAAVLGLPPAAAVLGLPPAAAEQGLPPAAAVLEAGRSADIASPADRAAQPSGVPGSLRPAGSGPGDDGAGRTGVAVHGDTDDSPPHAILAIPANDLVALDLTPSSPLLDNGRWLDPAALRSAIVAHLHGLPGVTGYLAAMPHRGGLPTRDEPATIALGIAVTLPERTPVHAPWAGSLSADAGGSLRLAAPGHPDLVLSGVGGWAAGHCSAGEVIARVATSTDPALPNHLHVQLAPAGLPAPTHVPASLSPAWAGLCPDPSYLLGLPSGAPPAPPGELLSRRHAVLADVQKTYFADPPEMVRGWRHLLLDSSGRAYLDGMNNVAVLGHSHPRVAHAVDRALRTLNTNSRFNLAEPVAFAEELLATLPAPLSRVFLVTSGSEAVDLALRLSRVHTAARDVIALRTAYHGWTTASDEVSSALMDNPRALATRPGWIHLAEPPNLYRGPHTGADAGARYAADVARILAELADAGRPLAGFIAETLNGNAGGIEYPDDYLPAVYDAVRDAGGVVIADEVQVGYGRLGCHFWGFQCAGVIPDIVCLAKATGNGFPVASVVTTNEIAQSFAAEGSFFASMGGTPAGAAAARATLAAICDEDLMGNAARMGARLRAGLDDLVARYPMAGAVHGRGLYLGLELVLDRASRAPATAATDALCERLLSLGVVMAATGDHMNVLKLKPPLCIDADGVDHLLAALDLCFAQGW